MSFGIDCVRSPSPAAMKAASVSFTCRYVGYFSGYDINKIDMAQGKVLTPVEAKANSQAGIALVSNFEWSAGRALEGENAGAQDAPLAEKIHLACGGPHGRPIYFSVDQNVSGDQVAPYFQGVASVLGLSQTGAYGSYRVLKYLFDNGLISWGWQTYAWSGGAWEPRAHIQQYKNSQTLAGASVDFDRSIKADFGQWFVAQEESMIDINTSGVSNWFEQIDEHHWHCKQTDKIVQFAILDFYRNNNGLLLFGLPLSNEIPLDDKGNCKQYYERACLAWDQQHIYDQPPGSGSVYTTHVYADKALGEDPLIPKLEEQITQLQSQIKPLDVSQLRADIHAIADAIAPPVAKVLADLNSLPGVLPEVPTQ